MFAAPPGGPGPITAAIQLTSTGSDLSSAYQWPWLTFGNGASPNKLVEATIDRSRSCGLICNGADGIEGDANGQAGGILFGNGGNGWNSTVAGVAGGDGGRAYGGKGGAGGDGGLGADGGGGGGGGGVFGSGGSGGDGG